MQCWGQPKSRPLCYRDHTPKRMERNLFDALLYEMVVPEVFRTALVRPLGVVC